MAANPLEQAIRSAVRANDTVGNLFARVGTSAHPRGFLPTAYRNARRAMRSALREENTVLAVSDVFTGLRRSIEMETRSLYADAQAAGLDESARQLSFYGVETVAPVYVFSGLESAALEAVMARLDAQEMTIRAQVISGAEAEQIIGNGEHSGTLRETDLAGTLAGWAASLVWLAFNNWTSAYMDTPGAFQFSKQAIAALDNRTTDCCLRVHGQIQPLARKFELSGSPRFADRLDWAPFHWWCRSAVALYLPGFDADITARMQAAAQAVLAERAAGKWIDRDPANAFG